LINLHRRIPPSEIKMSIPTLTLNNGRKMPLFGLGTWLSPPGQVTQAVKDAIDAGYRHFDGAHCYQNENEVGDGINAKIEEGVVKREDLFVTSKLWNSMHRADMVVQACRTTLKNLRLDYVDLYLIHWPVAYKDSFEDIFPKDKNGKFIPSDADFVDTWGAMEECVKLGLAKSIGVSNFNSEQISRILAKCTIKPVINQVELQPYHPQKKLEAWCLSKDIHLTAYSPLGNPTRPFGPALNLLADPKLAEIGKKYGKTPAQVAIRWVIQRNIVCIPKSVTKSRLVENKNVFDFVLSDADMAAIFALEKPNGEGRGCAELDADNHRDYPFHIEF